MQLVITLRKEIQNREQGEHLFELIKERMTDHPEVIVSGHVTNHFTEPEEPS